MSIFWKRRNRASNWARAACAAVIATMGMASGQPARAQGAVVCANCGSEYTQLANFLELVDQLEQQQALVKYAVRNTTGMRNFIGNNSIADIRAITDILRQGQALSYASANIDAQFSLKFKDYNGYVALKLNNQTMAAKYQQWSADANAATRTALKAANAQSQQMEGAEEARIRELEVRAQTTKGALEAQHAALELSVETVRQLQKLREIVLINMDLVAKHKQIESDERATKNAEKEQWREFTKEPSNLKATGGKQYKIKER